MRFFTVVISAISLAIPAFAGPTQTLHAINRYPGPVTGKYIVKLKKDASLTNILGKVGRGNVSDIWGIFNGFAGRLDEKALQIVRASPAVEYIEEDGFMRIAATTTQTNAPWGLSRISSTTKLGNQDDSALTFNYAYDSSAGAGVDVYVIDTGVLTSHTQFGERARWGTTFGRNYRDVDGNGHGTHIAGIIAGSQYGVAKAANIIAVKTFGDNGAGALSDIISGLHFVGSPTAGGSGRPSIVSLSTSGFPSTALDNAVTALVDMGIHAVVSAGNIHDDAGNYSPGRAAGALTVGASNIADEIAPFSNFGSTVDVFAPGMNVISSWIGSSNTATNVQNGSSVAVPHVSGLIAYLIGLEGNCSPAAMISKVQSLSLKGVLTGIPSDTVNSLAHNS